MFLCLSNKGDFIFVVGRNQPSVATDVNCLSAAATQEIFLFFHRLQPTFSRN